MKRKVYMILFFLFAGVFVYSAWNLFGIYRTYQEGDEIYEKAVEKVVKTEGTMPPSQATDEPEDQPDKEVKAEPMITVDFDALKKTNADVVGWLYIPNSTISYPLLQGEDNEQYLHQTYDGTSSILGSIFMDFRNQADLSDDHTIIYGHNMKNGSMFGTLKKYNDPAFYREHRNIYILTENGTYRYRVFSYHVADATGKVYTVHFDDTYTYEDYLALIMGSSYVSSKLSVTPKDRIITLSTCTGDEDSRFVVHAKYMGEVQQ